MDKYITKIEALRAELRTLWVNQDPRFCDVQRELDRVWANARAYCRRHNLEFPRQLYYAD